MRRLRPSKSENLAVRVSREVRDAFCRKAEPHGTPSEVLRELVLAFIEDRITMAPPKRSLFNVPGE